MSKKAKIFRIVLIVLISLLFLLYILFPVGVGLFVSIRVSAPPGQAPSGFESVSFKTEDNVDIAAWYKAPENGAAIIVIHGSNCSRENMRPYIDFLAGHGYGVLAVDLRGHGGSGGAANALGWQRQKDIGAALNFLRDKGVSTIGALGTSLGGESLLGVSSQFPEIKAIVSDGATHSTIADYLVLPSRENIFRSFTTRVMYFSAQIFTGQTPPGITMLDSIKASKDTRFLFIAAEDTNEEIEYNDVFLQAAGEHGELWSVPGAGHTQAQSLYPDEYEAKVITFFDSVLLN